MTKRSGRIELIIGPMFAGKTSELLRRLERHVYAKRNILTIFSQKDTIKKTHCGEEKSGGVYLTNLLDIKTDILEKCEVIGIDEGQFFPDLVDFCELCANKYGKIVIVAALDGDFKRNPFGQTCDLISKAERVDKLKAVCMICKDKDAAFSKRTSNETNVEVVGGSDIYLACCRQCYNKK